MRTIPFVIAVTLGAAALADPAPKLPPDAAVRAAPAPKAPPATAYLDVTCRWQRGTLVVGEVVRGRFERPTVGRRWTGRFEARVSGGGKPLDAVRFDFPLLGEADAGVQADLAERMRRAATSATRVRVPLPDGADAVVLVDTRGGPPVRVPLPAAPPDAAPASAPADAGAGAPPRP